MGAGALAAVCALAAGDASDAAAVAGACGAAAIAVGVVSGWGTVVTSGLVLAGTAYGLSLAGREVDVTAGFVAGGLLIVAELAYWAVEPGSSQRLEGALALRRGLAILALAAAAVLVGTLLLAISSPGLGGGAASGVAGVVAVAVLLVVVVAVLHPRRSPPVR